MPIWSDLYEKPTQLTTACGHHRIYSPLAYSRVRDCQISPIVHREALGMAAWHPVCWLATPEGHVACALRSLLPTGGGLSAGAKQNLAALPLILRAFPIIPGGEVGDRTIEFDQTIPDSPTDVGAPLLLADGKLSKGALQKCRAALLFRHARGETEGISADLAANGLLEPWPLDFELTSARRVAVENLWVLRPEATADRAIGRIIRQYGVDAASFLIAHRISLFRIATLLRGARAQARKTA